MSLKISIEQIEEYWDRMFTDLYEITELIQEMLIQEFLQEGTNEYWLEDEDWYYASE